MKIDAMMMLSVSYYRRWLYGNKHMSQGRVLIILFQFVSAPCVS